MKVSNDVNIGFYDCFSVFVALVYSFNKRKLCSESMYGCHAGSIPIEHYAIFVYTLCSFSLNSCGAS